MMSSRRSKRNRVDNGDVVEAKPNRINPRTASYCLEFGLPSRLCCSGCVAFAQSPSINLPIDSRDEFILEQFELALTARKETHSNHLYHCRQPWTWAEGTYVGTHEEEWISKVKQFIGKYHGRCHAIEPSTTTQRSSSSSTTTTTNINPTPRPAAPAAVAQRAAVSPEDNGIDNDINRTLEFPRDEPPTKKQRTVNKSSHIVNSQKQQFEVQDVPNSHMVIRKDEYERLKKMQEKVKNMQAALKRQRFVQDASPAFKTAMSVSLASTPGLPISAAAYQFPVVIAGFLEQYGLMDLDAAAGQPLKDDKGKKKAAYASSFPSERYMRDNMLDTAAEALLALGKLLSKQGSVYLACDKGNKNGIDHFVKMLSWFQDKQVQTRTIDISASGGTNIDCAEAVKAALKNLNCPLAFLLAGQITDSGGGGVLEGSAKLLMEHGLCVNDYIIAACCIHLLQLQLSNPTIKLFGEGGLKNRNAMQLLHGIYMIMDYMEWAEVVETLNLAQEFYNNNFDKDIDESKGSQGDKDFAKRWNKVRRFRSFEKIDPPTEDPETGRKKAKWTKAPACILTRWGYVGAASVHGHDMYLLLVKFCQIIINRFKASDKRNMAASDVQSLLLEEEVYCDVCFLKSFHLGYFNSHLAWLMGTKDLSQHPSFQTHNILVRYYVMSTELTDMKEHLLVDDDDFKDWRSAIDSLLPEEKKKTEQDIAMQFVDFAIDSMNRHFKRWCGPLLLPAALMAEEPLARKVALIMTGDDETSPEDQALYHSTVHKRVIDLNEFFDFVYDRASDALLMDDKYTEHLPLDLQCANKFLEGLRCRDIVDWDDATVHQKYMWKRFLPLPSQTQHVEAGVKESALVSSTGKEEEMRSAYAVVRALCLLPIGTLRNMDVNERVLKTLLSVRDHVEMVDGLKEDHQTYDTQLKNVRERLQQKHFKKERLDGLKNKLRDAAESNKKDNVRQKRTGVDDTATTMGLILYSGKDGLRKGTVVVASLKLELMERGLSEVEVDGLKNYTAMVKKLKEKEMERVAASTECPNDNAKSKALELAAKGFLQQTNPDEVSFENN